MVKNKYNISVVGQSNTGKSTLINYLYGKYITTESKKTQTTRINLHNIIQIKNLKVNIIDTPGISLNHKDLLSSSMKNAYVKTLVSLDLLILMVDISNKDFNFEESILKLNSISNTEVFIVINKIDLCRNYSLDEAYVYESFLGKHNNQNFFISLKSKYGINELINAIENTLLHKKPHQDEDKISEDDMRLSIQEIIRGIIVNKTHSEVPYDTAVHIEKTEIKKNIIEIKANIYVSKENQKKIIIGKKGEFIKQIGTESRILLEDIYHKKFFIELKVIIKENWKNNYLLLKEIGYID
tara:strand:+ start:1408 stop:2298 length:891 start_codon:yes stop_codon:yes gene_type:complete